MGSDEQKIPRKMPKPSRASRKEAKKIYQDLLGLKSRKKTKKGRRG